MRKKALIFGISGQDGVYLTKILIRKKLQFMGYLENSSIGRKI